MTRQDILWILIHAVASCVYGKYKKDTNDDTGNCYCMSTASPFKFTRSVMNAIDPAV